MHDILYKAIYNVGKQLVIFTSPSDVLSTNSDMKDRAGYLFTLVNLDL